MESRIQRIFLIIVWLVAQTFFLQMPVCHAQQVVEPEVEPRKVSEDEIDTEDFEIGLYFGSISIEDFGVNTTYGARLAYHVNEDFFVEMNYGVSEGEETSFETLSGGIALMTDDDRDYRYYNVSLGYTLLPGEAFFGELWAFNTAFFLLAGIGSTEFAGDDRFTFNVGAGYRILFTDWLALNLEMRDHMFDSDLLGDEKLTHNFAFTSSVSYFF